MTSELEAPNIKIEKYGSAKTAFLMGFSELISRDDSQATKLVKLQILKLMQTQIFFHENFYMFPLSNNRMMVLINPFFKFYKGQVDVDPRFGVPPNNFTMMPRLDVFDVNEATRNMIDNPHLWNLNDRYVYHPVKLRHEELTYCNALFLDRVHEWLGFTSLKSVHDSVVEYYIRGSPRNDYSGLLELLMKQPVD